MSYGYWSGVYRPKENLRGNEFHERQGKRTKLPEWDEKWNGLSSQARLAFLNHAKYQNSTEAQQRYRTSVPADKFPESALEELRDAGFVQVYPGTTPKKPRRVEVTGAAIEFALRVRVAQRYHLLEDSSTEELRRYVQHGFYTYALLDEIQAILDTAGIGGEVIELDETLKTYVTNRRWPGWVVGHVKDPLAEPVLEAVRQSEGRIAITELPQRIKNADPKQVRATVEKLLARLALFEGIDSDSGTLIVGFLPPVFQGMIAATQPRKRAPLIVGENLKSRGPTTGFAIDDLRAFLLEIAAEPPKLRQDGGIFQKHLDRFFQGLEPLPDWFNSFLSLTPEERLNRAFQLASKLKLVVTKRDKTTLYLGMSATGERWLAGTIDQQYLTVFQHLRDSGKPTYLDMDDALDPWLMNRIRGYGGWGEISGEREFLGSDVLVRPANPDRGKDRKPSAKSKGAANVDYRQELRQQLHRAFAELPVGVFHQLESILESAAFGAHNPLLLGKRSEEVRIYLEGKVIPPLEEFVESAGVVVLASLLVNRLVPMGCFQAGTNEEGNLFFARHPRLDAYFGQELAPEDISGMAAEGSKVVIQPDFSIIVIGPNPAPVAELAPFCERTQGRAAHGATTLKLTRESILKAVANGLTAEEIEKRLRRHSTIELPANVAKQVHSWASWVRQVDPRLYQVFSCPDAETADRILSILGRNAERFNATMIGFPSAALDAATRRKLRDGGILSEGESLPGTTQGRPAKRSRRRSWY